MFQHELKEDSVTLRCDDENGSGNVLAEQSTHALSVNVDPQSEQGGVQVVPARLEFVFDEPACPPLITMVHAILGQAAKNVVLTLPLWCISTNFICVSLLVAVLGFVSGALRVVEVTRLFKKRGADLLNTARVIPVESRRLTPLVYEAVANQRACFEDSGSSSVIRFRIPGIVSRGATYEMEIKAVSQSQSAVILRNVLSDSVTRKFFHGCPIFSHSASLLRAQADERRELLQKILEQVSQLAERPGLRINPAALVDVPAFDAPVLRGLLWSIGLSVVLWTFSSNTSINVAWAALNIFPMQFCTQLIWAAYLVKICRAARQLSKGTFQISSTEALLNGLFGPSIFAVLLWCWCVCLTFAYEKMGEHVLFYLLSIGGAFIVLSGPVFLSAVLVYRFIKAIGRVGQGSDTMPAPGVLSVVLILCSSMLPGLAFWLNISLESVPLAVCTQAILQFLGWTVSFLTLRKVCDYMRGVAASMQTTDKEESASLDQQSLHSSKVEQSTPAQEPQRKYFSWRQAWSCPRRIWQSYVNLPPHYRVGFATICGLLFVISIEVAHQYQPNLPAMVVTILALLYVCRPVNRSGMHSALASTDSSHCGSLRLTTLAFSDLSANCAGLHLLSSKRTSTDGVWGAVSTVSGGRRLGVFAVSALAFVVFIQMLVNFFPIELPMFLVACVVLIPLINWTCAPLIRKALPRLRALTHWFPRHYYQRSAKVLIALASLLLAVNTGLHLFYEGPTVCAKLNLLTKEQRLSLYELAIERNNTYKPYLDKASYLGSIGLVDQQLQTLKKSTEIFHRYTEAGWETGAEEIEALKNAGRVDEATALCKLFIPDAQHLICDNCHHVHLKLVKEASPRAMERIYRLYAELLNRSGDIKGEQQLLTAEAEVVANNPYWFWGQQ